MLIGLLCFWKRFFNFSSGILRFTGIALWIVLVALTLINIIGTQTRQVFIAFPVCLVAVAVWAVYEIRGGRFSV